MTHCHRTLHALKRMCYHGFIASYARLCSVLAGAFLLWRQHINPIPACILWWVSKAATAKRGQETRDGRCDYTWLGRNLLWWGAGAGGRAKESGLEVGAGLLLPVVLQETAACPGLSPQHPSMPTRPMSICASLYLGWQQLVKPLFVGILL